MMFATKKTIVAFTIGIAALLLSACLDQEEAETDFGGNDTGQNSAPRISGSPGDAIMMGDLYEFVPSAEDADGDRLTFSIEGRPRWADFSSSTGRLSGQPWLGDAGVYDQIVISVSDGSRTSALQAFSITVTEIALGSMTLSWTAPTEYDDGTALTDLAGYRLYYGRSEGSYPNKVVINNAGIVLYVVDNLLPATYYVVATAVNASGVESAFSNVTIRTVEET